MVLGAVLDREGGYRIAVVGEWVVVLLGASGGRIRFGAGPVSFGGRTHHMQANLHCADIFQTTVFEE